MKKLLFISLIMLSVVALCPSAYAATMAEKMSGSILLQVESKGEGWYVNPKTKSRHFLYRAPQAYQIMREQGIGITNSDLQKIPLGFYAIQDVDSDRDGLSDSFEIAIGSNISSSDTDNDGFNDLLEIIAGMNPNGGAISIDSSFAQHNDGKILLQVQAHGESWWVNPADHKRYYLGRASDALPLMRSFGIGISNTNIAMIPVSPTLMNCGDDFHCLGVALKLGQFSYANVNGSTITLKQSGSAYIYDSRPQSSSTKTVCSFSNKTALLTYLDHTETGTVTASESTRCSVVAR